MTGLPLSLDLAGRRAVVVGAGPVAARQVDQLLSADADIHVIAPAACEQIRELASQGRITWFAREYTAGDLPMRGWQ